MVTNNELWKKTKKRQVSPIVSLLFSKNKFLVENSHGKVNDLQKGKNKEAATGGVFKNFTKFTENTCVEVYL